MFRLLGIALCALALGACAKPPYTNVGNEEVKTLLAQGVPLYDVRRPDEWRATGIVAGSQTVTYVDKSGRANPAFMPRFGAEVAKDQPVMLICRTGNRTDKLARELMAQHGYTKVYNVRDGITGWIAEKNPVVPAPIQAIPR